MIPVILAVMIIMTFLICIIIDEFQIVESFQICVTSIPLLSSQSLFSGSLPFLFVLLYKKKEKNKRKEKKKKRKNVKDLSQTCLTFCDFCVLYLI